MKPIFLKSLIACFLLVFSSFAFGNTPPTVSGVNCQVSQKEIIDIAVCADEKVCFTVCSGDADTADAVTLSATTGGSGAIFTILNQGEKLQKGQFCWAPTEADVSSSPYLFVVTAKDNSNATSKRTFRITVKEMPKADYSPLYTGCGQARFIATKKGNTAISQYMWNLSGRIIVHRGGNADTVYHKYKYPGKKPFNLNLIGANGCNRVYSDTFTRPEYVDIKTSENMVVCEGTTLQLGATVTDAFGPYEVDWSTGQRFNNEGGTVSVTVGDRDTFVIAWVYDEYCNHADTTFIRVNNAVDFDLGRDIDILPLEEHEFRPTIFIDSLEADTVISYQWFKDDLTNEISTKPFLIANESATYFLVIKDSLECMSLDSVLLRVGISSVEAAGNKIGFSVFPNPAQNSLTLNISLERAFIEIFQLSGKMVMAGQVVSQESIDISKLAKGSYFVRLRSSKEDFEILHQLVLFKH